MLLSSLLNCTATLIETTLYLNKKKIQSLDSSSNLQLVSNLSTFESNNILHQTDSTVNSKQEEKATFV